MALHFLMRKPFDREKHTLRVNFIKHSAYKASNMSFYRLALIGYLCLFSPGQAPV